MITGALRDSDDPVRGSVIPVISWDSSSELEFSWEDSSINSFMGTYLLYLLISVFEYSHGVHLNCCEAYPAFRERQSLVRK